MLLVSANARNIEVMSTTSRLSGGYLRIYGGPRPAAPEVAVTTQTLFAECRFGSPAFGNPNNGSATANTIAPDPHIGADGVPLWFRALEADGLTAVLDGDIGEDLVTDDVFLVQPGSFSVTSLVYSRR